MKYLSRFDVAPQDGRSLALSPDGKYMAYIHESDHKCFVTYDGQEGRGHSKMIAGSLAFVPDSGHPAYIAEEGNEWFVVIDGKEGFHYDEARSLEQDIIRFKSSDTVSYLILEDKCLCEVREKIQ